MSLYTYSAAGLVALVLLAGSHWKAYRAGENTVKAEWQTAQIEFDRAARAKEQAIVKQLENARNEATKRETKLRADAGRARSESDGLRGDLAELRRQLPELDADACRVRADTLADVFNQCATRYSELAEKADRHASDAKTLMDGWPK